MDALLGNMLSRKCEQDPNLFRVKTVNIKLVAEADGTIIKLSISAPSLGNAVRKARRLYPGYKIGYPARETKRAVKR